MQTTEASTAAGVSIRGWLHKRGRGIGMFAERQRWFVLDEQRREVRWYVSPADEADEMARGAMQLDEVLSLEGGVGAFGEASFTLRLPTRTFELRADSTSGAQRWISALVPHLPTTAELKTTVLGGARSGGSPLAGWRLPGLDDASGCASSDDGTGPSLVPWSDPWQVSSVHLDSACSDGPGADGDGGSGRSVDAAQPLSLSASLGEVDPADLVLRVRLADGTVYVVDSNKYSLDDGCAHEIASAADSTLLAQIIAEEEPRKSPRNSPRESARGSARGSAAATWQTLLLGALLGATCTLVALLGGRSIDAGAWACTDGATWGGRTVGELIILHPLGSFALAATACAMAMRHFSRCPPARRDGRARHRLLLTASRRDATPRTSPRAARRDGSPPSACGSASPSANSSANFSGRWAVDLQRSDDSTVLLEALGVPWVARQALRHTPHREVHIIHSGDTWRETMTTSLLTKSTELRLDGSEQLELNPIDRAQVLLSSTVEDGGACVATWTRYADGERSQMVRRTLEDGGRTYHVAHELTLGAGQPPLRTHTYYAKVVDGGAVDTSTCN